MVLFNVHVTSQYIYSFRILRAGTFEIVPAEIAIGDQNPTTYRTNPIQLTVSGNGTSPSHTPPLQGSPQGGEDSNTTNSRLTPLEVLPEGAGFRSAVPTDPNVPFFIQVEVDRQSVVVGEQVTASWYLVTRAQITAIDTLKYPALRGFWKEDIHVSTRLHFTEELLSGVPYRRALLTRFALFPIKAGEAKLDTYLAKCTVMMPSTPPQGPFGAWPFRSLLATPKEVTYESPEVLIQVSDWPDMEGERPKEFLGAVGDFKIQSYLGGKQKRSEHPHK